MNLLLLSERYCFLENQLANEKISKAEYSLMDTWFNWASNAFEKSVKPDVVGKYDYSTRKNLNYPLISSISFKFFTFSVFKSKH